MDHDRGMELQCETWKDLAGKLELGSAKLPPRVYGRNGALYKPKMDEAMSNSVMAQFSNAAKRSIKAMVMVALLTGAGAGSASAQEWFPIGATWTYA